MQYTENASYSNGLCSRPVWLQTKQQLMPNTDHLRHTGPDQKFKTYKYVARRTGRTSGPSSFKVSGQTHALQTTGVTWLIPMGKQHRSWVLRTLIYDGVQLARWEDWFDPVLNTHTPYPLFVFICPSPTLQPRKTLLGYKKKLMAFPPTCPRSDAYAFRFASKAGYGPRRTSLALNESVIILSSH